jgi:RNA polymerase primary sigma factor
MQLYFKLNLKTIQKEEMPLNKKSKNQLLSFEREKELASIIKTSKCKFKKDSAIEEFFNMNLRLVNKEAIKYYNKCTYIELEELYNNGRIGLLRAIYDYDPFAYNTRFSTYATIWIQKYIREVLYNNNAVKIPNNIISSIYKKNKLLKNNNISDEKLQEELGVTDSQMNHLAMGEIETISLNHSLNEDMDANVGDIIEDPNAKIPGVYSNKDSRYEYMEEAFNELDDLSKEIIDMQIISDEKIKLSDIGIKYGITAERVRQIKQKGLCKLRRKIEIKMKKREYA